MTHIYRITIWAFNTLLETEALVGETEVVARNKAEAKGKALAGLWPTDTSTVNCVPAYQVWKLLDG